MSKTITSGGVAFMDLTDSRKLDAYITSNLPIAQIYNQNKKTYEPNWNTTNLQLSADIYLDAKSVTSDIHTSIVWYEKIGTKTQTEIKTDDTFTITSNTLTIKGNRLSSTNPIITYICEATYKVNDDDTNPPTAHTEITFTRVDTGLDGSNGADGTGVTILGSYDELSQLQTAHPTGNAGDAYIVAGDLYVWSIDTSKWENVGNIRGPAGANGRDAKSIILNGDSQVFKISKTNAITPSTIKITAQTFNTSVTNWSYSINGGQTFLSAVPTGVSRNGNIVTVTGATITSNSIVVKASDGEVEDVFTVYKAFDGTDGSKGDNGAPAPIVFLTNENITFSANAQGQIPLTTITSNIVAYSGTTKVTPTIGTITGAPTGMTITPSTITASNEVMLTISIANNSTLDSNANNMGVINIPITSPISTILSLTWSKVNTGAPGVSASLVDIVPSAYYFKSNMGKDGTFTPEFIYLYPRFQNAIYNGWQYSIDGGITWAAVTNANGLSVGTYNSIINTLRISRTSTLYTDTVTSISFRCNSLTNGIYDTISIAKIYDVIDLQIGGRNLLLNSGTSVTNSSYNIKNYYLSIPPIQGEQYTLTLKGTLGEGKTSFSAYNSGGTVLFGALKRLGTSDLYSHTFTWTNDGRTGLDTAIHIYTMTNAIVAESTIEWIKLEKGNKVTMDWTPAPEDINANIEKVDTRLTNSLAEIKTTTDSISSKVSSTEETVKSINNNITSLTTKISNAEQKITPTAIVSTVRQSTDYINDLGKKVDTNEIISKINQTAESVTISASKIGLLGATNIPDLTADKIKGGTLTLGGSSATTQNGQLLVKNASNVNMLKVNKDGIVVKSDHLAVAEDFANSTYNWSTNTWTTTTNTRQLDLSHNSIRMGVYSPSGYANYMKLLDDGLYFQGNAQGIGSWGSFIGHDDYGDFVIQDTVRGYIVFKGPDDDTEIANISGSGLSVRGVYSNTIASSANLHINSSGQFYRSTSSSQKYKTDIKDIQSEELNPEKLYDLPVREFKFKEGYLSKEDSCIDTLVPGFIAEEVAEVYPIACEYDGDNPENWNIRFIVPAMLKLIQNQKQEIDALKAEIKNMK